MAKLPPGKQQPRGTVTFSERKASRRDQLNSLKGQGPPLGGAPEIPRGKLAPLAMPQPEFDGGMDIPPQFQRQPMEPPPGMPPVGGVGSAYAVNQALASGDTEGPVSMGEANRRGLSGTRRGALSPETQELLKHAEVDESSDEEEEEESLQDRLEDADEDITTKAGIPFNLEVLDALRSDLLSKDRREFIESRLKPLNVADLVTRREIIQEVMVIENKLSYRLRTFSEREHIWCMKHLHNHQGSPRYMDELFNMFKMTCTLVGINGTLLPDHRKKPDSRDEEIDEKLFEKKFGIIVGYPVQLIADMSVQCIWFDDRVTKLFSVKELKNG